MAIKSNVKNQDKDSKKDEKKPDNKPSDDMLDIINSSDEDEDDDSDEDDDEDEGTALVEPKSNKSAIIIVVVVIAIVAGVAIFILTRPKPEPPKPPEPVQTEAPKPTGDMDKQKLYEIGIGKEGVDNKNIYDQGNIESIAFRKDFLGQDQPEMFAYPVKIKTVNDTVSYIKHRAYMGEGVEVYYLEAKYKGTPVVLTIPYSIYQTISTEGTLDVIVEVTTDANGSVTVTSISAIPIKTK